MEWRISNQHVDYDHAVDIMEQRVAAIHKQQAQELIWCLQHPPLFTAGTSAKQKDLLHTESFPVYQTGRGGEYTYHGPGQLVAYCMVNLKKRKPDVRHYVWQLEQWIINVLAQFNIVASRKEGRIGIWVDLENGKEAKIAAIGIRLRKWVSYHGFAININPDLTHFEGIVPCGIKEHGVTSMHELGVNSSFEQVVQAVQQEGKNIWKDS